MKKTNACTIQTTISKIPNSLPIIQKYGILQIKVSKICPALILARSRKHKVIGRTKILTISTKLKKKIKYHGEPIGNKALKGNTFIIRIRILQNQKHKAKDRLNLNTVVKGKL